MKWEWGNGSASGQEKYRRAWLVDKRSVMKKAMAMAKIRFGGWGKRREDKVYHRRCRRQRLTMLKAQREFKK